MENKGRTIEELNDEGWITDLAFLVNVTGRLNNFNRVKISSLPICIIISSPSESSFDCGKTN
jgi:hypothetical protein